MKQYLIDFFQYNKDANLKLLGAVRQLPEPEACIRLFSHFITTQRKWMNRVTKTEDDAMHAWFGEIFPPDSLEELWIASVQEWIDVIAQASEAQLETCIVFNRPSDSRPMGVTLQDIALQLNYHCIHHRAQVNTIIRQQGFTPPPTDYILTRLVEM